MPASRTPTARSSLRREWRRIVGTNLDAVFFWAQEAARRMLAAGKGGAIVNISSVLGLGVSKGTVAYATAKAGVIQLTKALGLELAFKGIRVNAIAPGWIVTELNRDYLASEKGRAIKRDIPVGRFGEARDLDGALLLLVSDAGRFIAGTTIVVDGGQMANFSEHENIPEDRLAIVRDKAQGRPVGAAVAKLRRRGSANGHWAAIYEEAARSIFGPLAINCMAPDDGNMNITQLVGLQ